MKVDLTQPILGFDGKPLSTINQESANAVAETAISVYEDIHGKGSAGPFIQAFNAKVKDRDLPSSIGMVCRSVLMRGVEDASEDKKLKYFEIGLKCSSDEADLEDSEREIIKQLVHKHKYTAITYARICKAFESDNAKSKEESADKNPTKKK